MRDSNIETLRYLGYVTHNADGSITSTAFRCAANLANAGQYLGGIMAGCKAASEWDLATAQLAAEQFPAGTRVAIRNSAFNRVIASGTVSEHFTERGRTYCRVLRDDGTTTDESVDSLDTL
jgi:hypothetical protein